MLVIRPLHFVDIMRDIGNGVRDFVPGPSGNNYHGVARQILENPDLDLELTLDPDDVCAPCRHHAGGECDATIDRSYRPAAPPRMHDWDLLINRRWLERFGLRPGARLSAKALARRLRDHADDMQAIYREILDDRIAAKERAVKQGTERYLGGLGA